MHRVDVDTRRIVGEEIAGVMEFLRHEGSSGGASSIQSSPLPVYALRVRSSELRERRGEAGLVARAEERCAGHERVGAGDAAFHGGREVDAAIDFEPEV